MYMGIGNEFIEIKIGTKDRQMADRKKTRENCYELNVWNQ